MDPQVTQVPQAAPIWIWTDEKVGQLTKLWDEGLSTAAIGERLGITKNAVVGKAHRLGLPPRLSPVKRRMEMRAAPPPPQLVLAPPPPRPMVPGSYKGPTCQWPLGHPREAGFRFCGSPALSGKPYCPEHAAVAYRPAQSKENAA
ncbi:MAG: global cell cycle regulator GcrA-like protein [Alphaproteobacteria bacterium]|nr:global cell cycle regulator GcrA-like protein [Alphaproteobacteria bacterium]